ncbi:MAG TPA: hypothetical protein DEG43_01335 [Acidimicrobiaceae bacterium]|nr:hypothetical protein [Acidimicrobiaceae bacterium]
MSAATSHDSSDSITDEEVDALVDETVRVTGVDLATLREFAERGRFDTEAQRRAWFLITGLGRG